MQRRSLAARIAWALNMLAEDTAAHLQAFVAHSVLTGGSEMIIIHIYVQFTPCFNLLTVLSVFWSLARRAAASILGFFRAPCALLEVGSPSRFMTGIQISVWRHTLCYRWGLQNSGAHK